MTTYLHTATHLLLASLKKVLGDENIQQKGSNITPERLRFDFNFPRPLTDEEKQAVEQEVNNAIARDIPIVCMEMSIEEAREKNAVGVFGWRYGEIVKVYQIGDVDMRRTSRSAYGTAWSLQDRKRAVVIGRYSQNKSYDTT